jgi:hypothetical protein
MADENGFDPFGQVKRFQASREGSGDTPGWQAQYGQKIQSLQDQYLKKKSIADYIVGLTKMGLAAAAAQKAGGGGGGFGNLTGGGGLGGTPAQNRALGMKLAAARGWTGAQWDAYDKLVMKESGWRNTAQNPKSTAYGIGQFLNSTWKGYGPKTSDPRTQIDYMLKYIANRYGDPTRALQFHLKNNWY